MKKYSVFGLVLAVLLLIAVGLIIKNGWLMGPVQANGFAESDSAEIEEAADLPEGKIVHMPILESEESDNRKILLSAPMRELIRDREEDEPIFAAWMEANKTSFESGEEVEVEMRLWNISEEEQTLNFRDGQVYDLLLMREGRDDEDQIKWRWSEGRAFTMALHSKTLKPGELRSWQESFELESDLESGSYKLLGLITDEEKIDFNCVQLEIAD